MSKRGRPHELTEAVVADVCAALTVTSSKDAAASAGISLSTYNRWRARGKTEYRNRQQGNKPNPDEDIFCEFWDRTERARMSRRMRLATSVQNAADKDPYLALKILAVIDPDNWSQKARVEHTGPDGGHIQIGPPDTSGLPPEKIAAFKQIMIEAGKAAGGTTDDTEDQ